MDLADEEVQGNACEGHAHRQPQLAHAEGVALGDEAQQGRTADGGTDQRTDQREGRGGTACDIVIIIGLDAAEEIERKPHQKYATCYDHDRENEGFSGIEHRRVFRFIDIVLIVITVLSEGEYITRGQTLVTRC